MLAINVSIPNLIMARLQQFRSPQLQIQRERPTDVGVDSKQTMFYPKASCTYERWRSCITSIILQYALQHSVRNRAFDTAKCAYRS